MLEDMYRSGRRIDALPDKQGEVHIGATHLERDVIRTSVTVMGNNGICSILEIPCTVTGAIPRMAPLMT